jgi:site-specific DNA-methyltransferase (adenine-specific)
MNGEVEVKNGEVVAFKRNEENVVIGTAHAVVESGPVTAEKRRGYMPESASDEWGTPLELFLALDDEFQFQIDAAASKENANCARFYTSEDDGLLQAWDAPTFINPPYGHDVGRWVEKAYQETMIVRRCPVAVLLLKSTTDVKWFHRFVYDEEAGAFRHGVKARFIKGRLKFMSRVEGESGQVAPFASVVVIFTRP